MLPGLADPVLDAQRIFRAVLDALAHPGRIVQIAEPSRAPAPLHRAATAVCLALCDFETPLWLDEVGNVTPVVDYLRFHTGAPIVAEPSAACFALIANGRAVPALDRFDAGSDEYPDRSTTVIVQIEAVGARRGRRLIGPGIRDETWLDVDDVPPAFWTDLATNHARFPRGIDVLLTTDTAVVGLPRTTRVESNERVQ